MLFALMMTMVPVAFATSVAAKDVVVNSQYVKATALCSCGLHEYNQYITASFVNYCPPCHSYETLEFNPKGAPEGEWTCTKCNSDYCAADGKEKIDGSKYYLTPYNETINNSNKTVTAAGNLQEVLLEQIALISDKSFF